MKRVGRYWAILLLVACAGPVFPADNNWRPSSAAVTAGEGLWSKDNNWSLWHAPTSTERTRIHGATVCVLDVATTTKGLYVGYNGRAGELRIVDGGSLSSVGGGWIGMVGEPGVIEVQEGGSLTCDDHFWVGLYNSSDGATLILNGGTVTVRGAFDLGRASTTAAGYVYLYEGTLAVEYLPGDLLRGTDDSFIDIQRGTWTINRDVVGIIEDLVAGEKVTAFGGAGRVLVDYGVTHPGKTTVRATESWIEPNWHVVDTPYPTDEIVITPVDAGDFGIVADGTTDVTDAIQTALLWIGNLGGGALYLPAGFYKVGGSLVIPSQVTLRGDWQQPKPGSPVSGTILQAYAGRGNENATPFIQLNNGAGIKDLSIWYPEQSPTDIQPYPPTIHGGSTTVENVTLVNAYFGFTTYREGITASPFLRHIYGTPLKTGIEYDCLADVGRLETVHFSPAYWADSGLPQAPTDGEHEAWLYNNGTGVIMRRIDWSYSAYVTVEGYHIGLALRPSRYDGNAPNGQSYQFSMQGCRTGVHVQVSSYAGYQFTRFDIQDAETGVYLEPSAKQTTLFHTCSIDAANRSVLNEGNGRVLMMSCNLQGTLRAEGGYLSVMNSYFGMTDNNHIELSNEVLDATILGNTFDGGAQIPRNRFKPFTIDHTPVAADPMPVYDYKKPTRVYRPATTDLYVVTESPYHAVADDVTDDTSAFQAALADAATNGGGTVFVPGGNYRLDGQLTVPTGVELRGVYDIPHNTRHKGSLLNVYAGRHDPTGTPFIQIESGAGVRGLTFHYPEQIYQTNDSVNYGMAPYPFLLRGLGADIYVINVAATIPYQLLDLATLRCDRHYVDYIKSTALKTGIHVGGGSVDGQIHNCQFNPSSFTHQGLYYDSIPTNSAEGIHKILWREARPYVLGHVTGQVLHENFVFGGSKGLHLVQENGFGPSGYCLGMGVDQCTNALQIDAIGSGGLDLINAQIVTVNGTIGRYLETGAALKEPFRMFSSSGWGIHQYSAALYGGDIRLQLFHLAHAGKTGTFLVANEASLQNLGGHLKGYIAPPRPFLTIDDAATAEFIGNIINTSTAQMPSNTANVTSIGNIKAR